MADPTDKPKPKAGQLDDPFRRIQEQLEDPDLDPYFRRRHEQILQERDKWVEEERRCQEERAAERAAREREAQSPIQRPRSPWSGCLPALLLITGWLLAIFVFGELALTVARYDGDSMDGADRVGEATVVSCQRQGPVGLGGFGYWDKCTASVVWEDGERRMLYPGKPGFFSQKDIGKTVKVGDLGLQKGGREYTSENLHPRRWLMPFTIVFALITGLLALPLVILPFFLAREWTRDGWRKLTRRPDVSKPL